jgi:hypothetical protein
MFETRFPQQPTEYAAGLDTLQVRYPNLWKPLRNHLDPTRQVWIGDWRAGHEHQLEKLPLCPGRGSGDL